MNTVNEHSFVAGTFNNPYIMPCQEVSNPDAFAAGLVGRVYPGWAIDKGILAHSLTREERAHKWKVVRAEVKHTRNCGQVVAYCQMIETDPLLEDPED
jgi:hypothetical protein